MSFSAMDLVYARRALEAYVAAARGNGLDEEHAEQVRVMVHNDELLTDIAEHFVTSGVSDRTAWPKLGAGVIFDAIFDRWLRGYYSRDERDANEG